MIADLLADTLSDDIIVHGKTHSDHDSSQRLTSRDSKAMVLGLTKTNASSLLTKFQSLAMFLVIKVFLLTLRRSRLSLVMLHQVTHLKFGHF